MTKDERRIFRATGQTPDRFEPSQPDDAPTTRVHTATPWIVDEVADGVCYVVAPEIALIAILDPSDDDAPALENARLIVRAVNSHDKLISALQGLFEHCAMVHKHWGEGSNQKEADAAIDAARAALTEVEK
jgi:hypothetical protein